MEWEVHEWRFHGLTTLGHTHITSYSVFTRRLIKIFDPRDPEAHFVELTKLKQQGDLEDYIVEYLKLSVMVANLTMRRRVSMFIDGIAETFHGLVKCTKPTTLLEAMETARDLQHTLPK